MQDFWVAHKFGHGLCLHQNRDQDPQYKLKTQTSIAYACNYRSGNVSEIKLSLSYVPPILEQLPLLPAIDAPGRQLSCVK